jgi:hypothetical protein
VSSFKFGTISNDFLFATSLAAPTAMTNYPVTNLYSSNRGAHFRRNAQGTSSTFDYDLSASYTMRPNFLIMARADILRISDSAAVAIEYSADDNSGFASPETDTLSLDSGDLVGRTEQDVYYALTPTVAERYHRVVITTTESSYHEISKMFFGNWIDLDREPLVKKRADYKRITGDQYHTRQEFMLDFKGITHQKRLEFYEQIDRHRHTKPLFILDTDDVILGGARLAQVRLTRVKYTSNFYKTDLSITLEEVY